MREVTSIILALELVQTVFVLLVAGFGVALVRRLRRVSSPSD